MVIGSFAAMCAVRVTVNLILRQDDRRTALRATTNALHLSQPAPDPQGEPGSGIAAEAQAWLDSRLTGGG